MRTPRIAFLLILLTGAAPAQQPGSTSYTPDRKTDAPTFMNAEVVRIDRASNRVTFRSESGETTLTLQGEALTGIARAARRGQGGRRLPDREGRRRARDPVRHLGRRPPRRPRASPEDACAPATSSRDPPCARACSSYDTRPAPRDGDRRIGRPPDARRRTRRCPEIDVLQPGANVAFNLGAAGTAVNVSGITSLGTTPVFANGVGFPAVNGQFVSFNSRTGHRHPRHYDRRARDVPGRHHRRRRLQRAAAGTQPRA